MKQLIILLSMLFLISFQIIAQGRVNIGIAGGPTGIFILKQNNFGVLQNDEFSDPIVRQSELAYLPFFGFTIEGNFGYVFENTKPYKKRQLALESAIIYSKQGQHYEDNMYEESAEGERKNVKRNIDLSYIQIPLLFKYKTGSEKHKFYFSTGPQFSFLIVANEEIFIDNEEKDYGITESQRFRNFDFGLVLNFGYEYHINDNLNLSIGWHTYLGAIDLNGQFIRDLGWYSKNDEGYRKSRNFRTGLNVGVSYSFGKKMKY